MHKIFDTIKIAYPHNEGGGVRLFFVPSVDDRCGISIQVQCGALDAAAGQEEVCHLVEHLIIESPFKETGKSFAMAASAYFDDIAATTGFYDTAFTALPKKEKDLNTPQNLLKFLEYMLAVIFEARFSQKIFTKEKKSILNELEARQQRDTETQTFIKEFFGTPDFLRFYTSCLSHAQKITLDDCQQFYQKIFSKAAVDIVLMGNFSVKKTTTLVKEKITPRLQHSIKKDFVFTPHIKVETQRIHVPIHNGENGKDAGLKYLWITAFFDQMEKFFVSQGVIAEKLEACVKAFVDAGVYTCFLPNVSAQKMLFGINQALTHVAALPKAGFLILKETVLNDLTSDQAVDRTAFLLGIPWDMAFESQIKNHLSFESFQDFAEQQKSLPIV